MGRPRGRGVADARLAPAAARGPVGGARARHARVRDARARGPETRRTARGVLLARRARRHVRSARRRRRRRRALGGRAGDALRAREARARRGADARAQPERARERLCDGGDAFAERGARAGYASQRQAADAALRAPPRFFFFLEFPLIRGLPHGRRVWREPARGRGGGDVVRAGGVRPAGAAAERRTRRARRVFIRVGGGARETRKRREPTRPARDSSRARARRGGLPVRARLGEAAASARG